MYVCIIMCIYIHIFLFIICIYIYMEREIERQSERERENRESRLGFRTTSQILSAWLRSGDDRVQEAETVVVDLHIYLNRVLGSTTDG